MSRRSRAYPLQLPAETVNLKGERVGTIYIGKCTDMSGWQFEEPNPIKRCTIQLGLGLPLSSTVIREISAMHGQFKRELPRKVEQQMLAINVGGIPGSIAAPPTRNIGGVVFDVVSPSGESSQGIVVGPTLLSYFTASYTRWVEFWPFASRLVTTVCEHALRSAPLVSLALEYQDQFSWSGNKQELDLRLLFKSDYEYLPAWFLTRKDACHNFQGWIERSTEFPDKQVIHNLNVTLSDPSDPSEQLPTCTIIISHRNQFNSGLKFSEFSKIFEPTMLTMRKIDKNLLTSILSEQVSAKIPGLQD